MIGVLRRSNSKAPLLPAIRSSLCLSDHGWEVADREARDLAAEVLRLMGAVRPTWEQGQREYVEPRENCRWCATPLPEEEFGGLRKGYFCSVECARAAILHRELKTTKRQDKVAVAAHSIIERATRPTMTCEQCGKNFKPYTRTAIDQKYCSHHCSALAHRTVEERACKTCGAMFRPKQLAKAGLYCSDACFRARTLPARECILCSTVFIPKMETAQFCSETCNKRSYKIRAGTIKRISPPVLDYLFRQQGLRITGERMAA